MEKLRKLKEKINFVIKSNDKTEILEQVNSLKDYKPSEFFVKEIIGLNNELFEQMEIEDFRFHSLLTIQQAMIEISGLGLQEIHLKLK